MRQTALCVTQNKKYVTAQRMPASCDCQSPAIGSGVPQPPAAVARPRSVPQLIVRPPRCRAEGVDLVLAELLEGVEVGVTSYHPAEHS